MTHRQRFSSAPPRARAAALRRVVAFLLPCLALGGCAALPFAGPDCDDFRFDARAWAKGPGDSFDSPTRRQRLADALVDCRRLEGLDRAAVRRLLGPADDRSPDGTRRSWTLGPERGYGVDYESLEVLFDARERVRAAKVVQD